MKRIRFWRWCCSWASAPAPAAAAGFSNWAVLIVAGDDHAHSGAHAEVFDNARRDLARPSPASASPATWCNSRSSRHGCRSRPMSGNIANALWDLTNRATGGCLIYFTSHGSPDRHRDRHDAILAPDTVPHRQQCLRPKPSVDRDVGLLFRASSCRCWRRPTAWCSRRRGPTAPASAAAMSDHYTFFDGCFLQSLPQTGNFPRTWRDRAGAYASSSAAGNKP